MVAMVVGVNRNVVLWRDKLTRGNRVVVASRMIRGIGGHGKLAGTLVA